MTSTDVEARLAAIARSRDAGPRTRRPHTVDGLFDRRAPAPEMVEALDAFREARRDHAAILDELRHIEHDYAIETSAAPSPDELLRAAVGLAVPYRAGLRKETT